MGRYCKIFPKRLMKLVRLCTTEFAVSFQKNFYRQVKGVSMGTPIAPCVSEYFLQEIDEKIVHLSKVRLYRRYVDDCFIVVKREEKEDLLSELNNLHPNIKFTSSDEQNGCLNYLDCKILRNGEKISTSVYRKPFQPLLISRYESNQPFRFKRNIIYGMYYRASRVCSNLELYHAEVAVIEKILLNSGYSESFVKREYARFSRGKIVFEGPNRLPLYFGIEYMGNETPRFLRRIGAIFRKLLPPDKELKFYYRNSTKLIHRFSRTYKDVVQSSMGVVYRIECGTCGKSYVGETGRRLSVRVSEHERSAVKSDCTMHSHVAQGHKMDFENPKILFAEKNFAKRKLAESFFMEKFVLIDGNEMSLKPFLSVKYTIFVMFTYLTYLIGIGRQKCTNRTYHIYICSDYFLDIWSFLSIFRNVFVMCSYSPL